MDRPTLARMIDHTLLRPEATAADVAVMCAEATELGVAAVCTSPSLLPLTAPLGSGIAIAAVVGFPSGAHRPAVKAREAELAVNHFRRAQLATMAGNAALADSRGDAALSALALAATDAAASGNAGLQSVVETDRARALVMLAREAEAEAVLAAARTFDAQNAFAWLLSATLARRLGKLDEAQGFIETAAALSPNYPEVGLEAGVIAMLQGREDAAAASWRSVVALEPGSAAAETARAYLAQLAEEPAAQ